MRTLLLAFVLACAACRSAPEASPWSADARAGIENAALAELAAESWEADLRAAPRWATELGDPRWNGALEDNTLAGARARTATLQDELARAEALPAAQLSVQDRITLDVLCLRWKLAIEEFELGIDTASWNLDPRGGPQNEFLTLAPDQPAKNAREEAQTRARWLAMPEYLDRCIENLRRGLAHGRVASHKAAADTLEQLDRLLATPVSKSPLGAPGKRDAAFAAELDELVSARIYPAFARYRDCVRDEVLPRARDDQHPGICFVEGGQPYYRLCIERETSLQLSPEEIHAFGKSEVARIRDEIRALGRQVIGTEELSAIQQRLRNDPAQHYENAEQILEQARNTLARAQAQLPRLFGVLPRTPCEVTPIPEHEAPFTTIAYYRPPTADGSRPGRYYVNTYQPATRVRFEAEALCFHESVPGHHLQIALAQEARGLPLARRHFAQNAFVEGWALYCERLADEQGMYSGAVDRLGMLSYDAWRASRLVVDTGLHAFGWSRDAAIRFMLENTLLAPNNIENEVDRYISWPGQALGYKLGQREILRLRDEARAALGAGFRLSDFHDRVLENGGVSLGVLRERIEAWIRAEQAKPRPPVTGGS